MILKKMHSFNHVFINSLVVGTMKWGKHIGCAFKNLNVLRRVTNIGLYTYALPNLYMDSTQ